MTQPIQKIPAGLEHPIPHLCCSPCGEAIEFYKKAFGAVEQSRMPTPDGRIMHACLHLGGSPIFLVDDFPEYCEGKSESPQALGGSPVTIHRYVEDCDAAVRRAADAGATVVMPPADMFWGDRYAVLVDPFGHKWSIATHIKDQTPDETQKAMNEVFAQAPA